MAVGTAVIAETLPRDRYEFPFVTGRVKCELDDTMGGVIAHFAIWLNYANLIKWRTAGAGNELTNAARVCLGIGILRREAFVNVIVPAH